MLSIAQFAFRSIHHSPISSLGHRLIRRPEVLTPPKTAIRNRQNLRTLFELHAGRQDLEFPTDLFIDEGSSVLSRKNDLPRTTSRELIEALGPIGIEYERSQEYTGRSDLSYSDAATAVVDWREARRQVEENAKSIRDERWGLHPKDLLVQYLRYVRPALEYQTRLGNTASSSELDRALLKLFNLRNELYFKKRGWDVTHLMDWAWILSGDTAERAAARLACVGKMGMEGIGTHKVVPQFVSTFLLRRKSMNAPALNVILKYIWDYMRRLSEQQARADNLKILDQTALRETRQQPLRMKEFVFMLIIIRLLRNAARVMPAAYESIVALLCRYLDDRLIMRDLDGENAVESRLAALTFMYNSALVLIAYPASLQPFRSATYQQRAQFMILRRMTQFDPPLLVDRRGYRAVTRIQLMQKKTVREREWAHFKALSWPPWKENRLGIDADIGPEHGISQAKEVLNQAKEAGYAADDWDDAASILAGWDTDESPTIQTRTMLKDRSMRAELRANSRIWMARIKATRTLQEAWAAFLSYEDSTVIQSQIVYYAMFEKLFQDYKRLQSKKAKDSMTRSEHVAGDGLEVSPAPIAPHHTVYLRIQPPNISEFLQRMIDRGVKPKAQGRFVCMLLRNAPSLAFGIRCLKSCNLQQKYTNALLIHPTDPQEQLKTRELVSKVPTSLFAAFIAFLARFARSKSVLIHKINANEAANAKVGKINDENKDVTTTGIYLNPVRQAVLLVLDRQPRERAPWYSVLVALAHSGVISPLETRSEFRSYSAVANWKTSCTMLKLMEELDIQLDLLAVKILCTGLENAIFEAEQLLHQKNREEHVDDALKADLEFVLDHSVPQIKYIFKDIIRSERMQQDIPHHVVASQVQQDQASLAPNEERGVSLMHDDDLNDIDAEMEDDDMQTVPAQSNYLPPACMIPKLLEVPDPAQLHSLIRILGLRRDHQGILDLVDWMALFHEEIKAAYEETQNGSKMMRRCAIAIRVFLERSWLYYEHADDEQTRLNEMFRHIEPAPVEVWQAVRTIILDMKDWGGWPTDEEVERYCMKGRFL